MDRQAFQEEIFGLRQEPPVPWAETVGITPDRWEGVDGDARFTVERHYLELPEQPTQRYMVLWVTGSVEEKARLTSEFSTFLGMPPTSARIRDDEDLADVLGWRFTDDMEPQAG